MKRSVTSVDMNGYGKRSVQMSLCVHPWRVMLRDGNQKPFLTMIIRDNCVDNIKLDNTSYHIINDKYYNNFKSKVMEKVFGFIVNKCGKRYYILNGNVIVASLKIDNINNVFKISSLGHYNWVIEEFHGHNRYTDAHVPDEVLSQALSSIGIYGDANFEEIKKMYFSKNEMVDTLV